MFPRPVALLSVLALIPAAQLPAQLRPIETFDWQVFAPRIDVIGSVGAAVLSKQRISLKSETGTLAELGNIRMLVRLDRVALETYGTVTRRFEPDGNATRNRARQDIGQVHVATTVLLTPRGAQHSAALRFGVGIPTTDDRIGLDRDETDFFAAALGRAVRGPVALNASLGLGIFGARTATREQNDVWLYSAGVARAHGLVRPLVEVVGHAGTPGNLEIVGNENLSEVRAGVQVGHYRFLEVLVIGGLADYSPNAGVRATIGFRR